MRQGIAVIQILRGKSRSHGFRHVSRGAFSFYDYHSTFDVECATTNPASQCRTTRRTATNGKRNANKKKATPVECYLSSVQRFFFVGGRGSSKCHCFSKLFVRLIPGERIPPRATNDDTTLSAACCQWQSYTTPRSALINPSGVINRVEINLNKRLSRVVSQARVGPNRVTDHDDGDGDGRRVSILVGVVEEIDLAASVGTLLQRGWP